MNKKLLEQIKQLKGVKMITPVEGNEIIVTFEPAEEAVKCETKKQYDWLYKKIIDRRPDYYCEFLSNYDKGYVLNAIDIKRERCADAKWYSKNGYSIIPFETYVERENLKGEFMSYLYEEIKKRDSKQISGIFKTFMKGDQFVSFAGNERFLSDFPVMVLSITATKEAAELFYSKIAIKDLELVTIEYTVKN